MLVNLRNVVLFVKRKIERERESSMLRKLKPYYSYVDRKGALLITLIL